MVGNAGTRRVCVCVQQVCGEGGGGGGYVTRLIRRRLAQHSQVG